MSNTEKIEVQVRQPFNAPAERIYDSFLDPERARKFLFATFTGKMVVAEIDPKVGGRFTFVDRRESGDAAHYGKYLELNRPSRIVFEFSVQKDSPEADRVTVDIKPLAKGCEVTLTHEISADYEHLIERVQQGWESVLDGLGATLRRR